MNSIREKAQEIRVVGEEERGRFEATGTPLRAYNYWLDESRSNHAKDVRAGMKKENFCHFWRVVAFWAPLMFLKIKLADALESTAVQVGIAILAVVALVISAVLFESVLTPLLFIVGIVLAVAALVGLVIGVHAICENISPGNGDELMASGLLYIGGTFIVALVGTILWKSIVDYGWMVLAWVAGAVAGVLAIIAVVLLLSTVAGYYRAKRHEKEAELDDVDEDLFDYEIVWQEPREPGKVAVFFSNLFRAIGDYLILAGQIVRVKKWKICPLVDIDTARNSQV